MLVVRGHARSRLNGHDCPECSAGRPGQASGDGDGRDPRMRGGRARANVHAPDARTRARRAGVRDPRLPGV
ncbi:hypothetical protein L810_5669 [Burkholderia sp. AU4i]|nr:hypothetical protein L810_5669 [Burkholderia sp. AU4i]